jgi:chromosome segregation ATPase
MNSPDFNPALSAEELEETVELPVLPDTAMSSALAEVDGAPVAGAPEVAPAADVAPATEQRGRLESGLRSLTDNLRTLEEKLRTKSEQLSIFEREVGARDRRIAELEAGAARRDKEINAAGVTTATLLEQISALSGRLAETEAARRQHAEQYARVVSEQSARESALAHAAARLTDLGARSERYSEILQTAEGRRHVYEGMVAEREAHIQSAQEQLVALEQRFATNQLQSQTQEQSLQAELGRQRVSASELEQQLLQAQQSGLSLREELQRQQAGAEQDRQSATRRISALESELAGSAAQAAARQQSLTDTLTAEKTLVSELNSSVDGLRRDLSGMQAQLAAALQNTTRLEAELRDHRDLAEAQQEQLSVARLRADNGAADLVAAEERLRTTEGESRQRELKIEQLTAVEREVRERIARLDRSLEERNALIGRLESEAASSAAVLGNIQHNLETLGNEPVRHSGQTGNNAVLRMTGEKMARLLVRTKGDTSVMHVLGRRTTIGRTPDNDLQIDTESISRHHAVVLVSNDATVIEDLNSTNGVHVNGSKVNRATLNEGDVITIGVTTLRFVLKPVAERATQN